eukprot:GAHX01000849.1.p1 GENE.GAHX01000849.1~~GAHX01000849.1.p1  ORF type:complete len:812 (+),score=185.82 GAHX01000849.1:27-2462(+)
MGNCLSKRNEIQLTSQQKALTKNTNKLTTDQIYKKLVKVPLLRNIPGNFIETLSTKVRIKNFDSGVSIIKEDGIGDEFYIIVSGEVSIEKKGKENPEEVVKIAKLTPRDYFGEIALLRDVKRTASAIAISETLCLVLDREIFKQAKKFIKFPKRMAVCHTAIENFTLPGVSEEDFIKTKVDIELIEKAISNSKLLTSPESNSLSHERIRKLIEGMVSKHYKKGDMVIKEKEEGHYFYVVADGLFHIQAREKLLKVSKTGDSFGELSLLHNSPRNASIICKEDGKLWALHRVDYQRIVKKVSKEKFSKIIEFLSKVKIFDRLITSERTVLASVIIEDIYPEHSSIIKEGEQGDCMFLILKGSVQVSKKVKENKSTNNEEARDSVAEFLDDKGKDKEINRLSTGDYFGEVALLKEEPRNATITAINGPVTVLKISRSQFNSYCGTLKELMERQIDSYENKIEVFDLVKPEVKETKNIWNRVALSDLTVIGQLGCGSFGKVKLIEINLNNFKDCDEDTVSQLKGTFALKCISKKKIVELGQQDHVINEKTIMSYCNSDFIIRLFKSFRSEDQVFMLMEACLGGELFSRLRIVSSFNESHARFYLANVIEAIGYLHSLGIVYRDLKPENLLIADNGYLKLADLGFSKMIVDKTWTLCGTPDYLAPEIVSGHGHGKPADIWTLGVLLYEMLVSYPPFFDEDQGETYVKIIHSGPDIPTYLSKCARNLIESLLQKKEYKRIGTTKTGLDEIRNHPFFKGFDWDSLRKSKMTPPFIPKIQNKNDISNFDESFLTTELVGEYEGFKSDDGLISEWETHF